MATSPLILSETEFRRTVLHRMASVHAELLFLNSWSAKIMGALEDLQSSVDGLKTDNAALKAAAADAKADAARQSDLVNTAIGLLQALTQRITDLSQNPGGATATQLAALLLEVNAARTDVATAKADLDTANTQRDAADASLSQGVQDNTPQS